jgi:predicted kinase
MTADQEASMATGWASDASPAPRLPVAVFVAGPAGSGKTTLARALAPALGAALLDLDVATGPLTALVLELIGARDYADPRAAELTRARRYETLLNLAADNADAGLSTVLVAPFTAERSLRGWQAAAARLSAGSEPRLVWLTVPTAELTRRLMARGAARDADKRANPEAWVASLAAEPPEAPHLALDATRPVAELVDAVLNDLRGRAASH